MKIAFPHRPGSGGPGSFQSRFEEQILKKGGQILYASTFKTLPDFVFVVAGTRKLFWLIKMKLRGVPILYRLDGINWLHRKKKLSLRFLIAEYRNWNNKIIHAFLSDHIIYQSEFVKKWWEDSGLKKKKRTSIIHNGVDLEIFKPIVESDTIDLVCVEGTIDYSPYAIELLNRLTGKLPKNIKLRLYGGFDNIRNKTKLNRNIHYFGKINREEVPKVLSRSIYLSLDVNPACPNTVIEALACGSPVVGFDTGALKELIPLGCGIIVPYGSNPWNLKLPDVDGLSEAVLKIKEDFRVYSNAARKHAEQNFDINLIYSKYVEVFECLKK